MGIPYHPEAKGSNTEWLELDELSGYSVRKMNYAILLERIDDRSFPEGYYYAHIPSLGLTTHGLGVEGAREAAKDLLKLWIAEKKASGEVVPAPGEFLFATVELSQDALQSA
jgi:predicted RNase H-like HicB family nuclease